MTINIKIIQSSVADIWDVYIHANSAATLYHLFGWKNVIKKTYGHKTYYLIATQPGKLNNANNSINTTDPSCSTNEVVGVLPLVHLQHFMFGNSLISIPFFDLGGILADNKEAEEALLSEAIKLGQKLKVNNIELRQIKPLAWFYSTNSITRGNLINAATCAIKSHKVRMLLELPDSSEALMKSFKSKLRSQIKKPLKEGLVSIIGGMELLNDFYDVFSVNMRNLGSPVHSKRLIRNVIEEFPDKSRIVMVYKGKHPMAGSIITGFNNILENPWASSLRQYCRLSPNMLLYWTMLEYACDNGYSYFNFGRSSPDEGTYKFKKQWGAKPEPLYWHYLSVNGATIDCEISEKSKFNKAIQYWQKIPVSVTKVIGPKIRKHIGL